MAKKSSINLLLINESANDSERLVTTFRNAGRVARANRADSLEELLEQLKNERFDLLIADGRHPNISIQQALEAVSNLAIDLPAIAISDDPDTVATAWQNDVADVLGNEEEQRLTAAAFRELKNLHARRQRAELEEKLADAEQRAALLMSESSEAIAYIADGMIISCNEVFAEKFGYDSADDVDCMPIIDLIAEKDSDKFKILLKAQSSQGEKSNDMAFSGISQSGEEFSAAMQLSNAVYDEEQCIQLTIHDQLGASAASTGGGTEPNLDPETGLFSPSYFLSQLSSTITQAQGGNSRYTLLFIGVDQFGKLRQNCGLSASRQAFKDLAGFIKEQSSDDCHLSHFCDDAFTLLLADKAGSEALTFAKELCQKFSAHAIAQVPNWQVSVSIGVLEIDGSITEPSLLVDHAFTGCCQVRDQANHDGIGNDALLYVPPKERKALGDAKSDAELDTILEEALEDGHFWLMYQPLISIRGASGDHYEVKTLMRDADGNELAAADFLQSLHFQQTNTRLDRWVILEATKQLSSQRDNGHDVRLLINLTAHSLNDPDLIPWLGVALKAGGLAPESLILQFQEQDIADNLNAARQFADTLKEIGCELAIANFGNQEEPLKLLSNVSAGYLRITDNFTAIMQSGGDTQIFKAVIATIGEQGCRSIITGVDNASLMAQLWTFGVDFIQGSYLAPPSQVMDYEFTDIA
jgi:diguanylate cyclase (GGDEF)-like protein/PAS domain S-box-containing protein